MAYIPGSGDKQRKIQPQKETSEVETEIKKPAEEEKIVFKKNAKRSISLKGGFLLFFLIVSVLISLIFSTVSILQNRLFFKTINSQIVSIKEKTDLENEKQDSSIKELKTYLEPKGIVDKFIFSQNLMESQIVGVNDILRISEESSFKTVGFLRILITGSKPVWIGISNSDGKKVFDKILNPGLSEEMIYYYKEPKINLSSVTYQVNRNFKVSSGDFEKTYIVFFSLGTVKIAKMESKDISNVLDKFGIWLPQL